MEAKNVLSACVPKGTGGEKGNPLGRKVLELGTPVTPPDEEIRLNAIFTTHAALAPSKFMQAMDRFSKVPAFPDHPDDSTIKLALKQAQPELMQLCLAHITGNADALKVDNRVELEKQMFKALCDLRESRASVPEMDKSPVFKEMVEHCSAPLPAYAYPAPARGKLSPLAQDFIMDEMYGYPDAMTYTDIPDAQKLKYHVVIVGSGVCGISLAVRLKMAGIPFTILEKYNGVGGTWFLNTFPGVKCDTAAHMYCYAHDPNMDWTKYFARGQEMHRYLMKVCEKYELMPHVVTGAEVLTSNFQDDKGVWEVTYRTTTGIKKMIGNAFVSAVGMLSNPNIPPVDGLDKFKGVQMHSSRYRPGTDFNGKKVALVGTGATGMLYSRELAAKASKLTVFQGTPQWFLHIPNYRSDIPLGERWCFANVPYYERWHRFKLLRHLTDQYYEAMQNGSELNKAYWDLLKGHIEEKLKGRPDLLKKVLPQYPPICTRLLVDNNWCETLCKENVDLVTSKVKKLTENKLISADGTEVEADVIVWATGFKSTRFLLPAMNVKGSKGVDLNDVWGDEPTAYLGITAPQFPNMFMTYGPNSNVSAGGSIVWVGENQARYIMQCIGSMVRMNAKTFEVKKTVHDTYNAEVEKELQTTAWMDPRATSWYKRGMKTKVTCNSPFPLEEYNKRTRNVNLDDFDIASF